uniref:Signal recognition particle subunit SRP68 n=1 Tax=Globisporangium ultimum (strain ATCC 200006 / CBS 805.95 / DAOM BR144) TaxID=431595 RepID=K3XAM4_GLOUD
MAKKAAADVVMADANEVFSIPILETVKAAQMQNGLRHRDFQRYRQYCARRLRRIRKSVKFTHGKGKIFLNKKVDAETATEARHLYLPLYNAERAWSYAMQLKEDDNLDKAEHGEDANTRIKFHLTGRLRKASDWSQRLATICAAKADARTSLEAEAYAAYMAGNLAFHREEHVVALDKFATARRIYSDLSQVGTPSQKELFRTLMEELEPFIRFSEHRLSIQGKLKKSILSESSSSDWSTSGDSASNSLLQSKIDLVLLEARKQKVVNLATVEWKQKQIALPSQELGLALLRPDEISAKVEKVSDDKKREQLYLELLSSYDAILQMIKNDIAKLQQQSKSGSALVHTDIEALQALEEYVRFTKLTKQVERTVIVFKQLKFSDKALQPGDLTHILNMLIQYVGEILMIPGLADFEKLLAAKYNAYQAVFKAIRGATIAQAYLEDSKFSEALALYHYASGFLTEGEDILSVHPGAKDVVLQEFIKDLGEELVGAQSRTTAQAFLEVSSQEDAVRSQLSHLKIDNDSSKKAQKKKKKSLLERQNDYVGGTAKGQYEIVRLPPDFQAIACKPLLFDMAFNELEMPDISARMKTEEEKKAEAEAATAKPAAGGIFGWFRG